MSSPLRIELRPSRVIHAVLLGLAVLAACALKLSALSPWSLLAVPALLALAWPRESPLPGDELVLRDDGSAVLLAEQGGETEIDATRLQRRGWLTVLTLASRGRMRVHLFTPATLDAAAARGLHLWYERHVKHPPKPTGVPGV